MNNSASTSKTLFFMGVFYGAGFIVSFTYLYTTIQGTPWLIAFACEGSDIYCAIMKMAQPIVLVVSIVIILMVVASTRVDSKVYEGMVND